MFFPDLGKELGIVIGLIFGAGVVVGSLFTWAVL